MTCRADFASGSAAGLLNVSSLLSGHESEELPCISKLSFFSASGSGSANHSNPRTSNPLPNPANQSCNIFIAILTRSSLTSLSPSVSSSSLPSPLLPLVPALQASNGTKTATSSALTSLQNREPVHPASPPNAFNPRHLKLTR